MSDESGASPLVSALNQSGLPNTLRGKAHRAILRWLAGSIGHPYFRQVRENLDEIEGRSRVNMMIAEEVGRQAIADPELIERAKARLLGDTLRKQENVEAIARAANEKIGEDPEVDVPSDRDEQPSDDWMNAFTREAEAASSDDLRERLANLLAGEIREPGAYSRATIRAVAELDQDTLLKFQNVLSRKVGRNILRGQDWNEGTYFSIGVQLEDAGLISGSGGTSWLRYCLKNERVADLRLIGRRVHYSSAAREAGQGLLALITADRSSIHKVMPLSGSSPASTTPVVAASVASNPTWEEIEAMLDEIAA